MERIFLLLSFKNFKFLHPSIRKKVVYSLLFRLFMFYYSLLVERESYTV